MDALQARGFVEVVATAELAIDLRYATADNFLGAPVYGGFDRLFLHPIAAEKLGRAVAGLRAAGGYRLVVYDGLRPNRIQRLMWAAVAGGPQQVYVADPAIGSIHGYGLALDLSLLGPDGQACDMGTAFDAFSPQAEPRREDECLAAGTLTTAQLQNRRRLRDVMVAADFHPIAIEWWHFDALPPDVVRAGFELVE